MANQKAGLNVFSDSSGIELTYTTYLSTPTQIHTAKGSFIAIYHNASERLAATGFTASALYRQALQLDTMQVWVITEITNGVPVWEAVTIEPATAISRGAVRVNTPAPPGDPVVYRREEVDALLSGGNAFDLLTTVDLDGSIMFLCTDEGRPIWYQPGG